MKLPKILQRLVGADNENTFTKTIREAETACNIASERARDAEADHKVAIEALAAAKAAQSEALADGGAYNPTDIDKCEAVVKAAETRAAVMNGAVVASAHSLEVARTAHRDWQRKEAEREARADYAAVIDVINGPLVGACARLAGSRAVAASLGVRLPDEFNVGMIKAWADATAKELAPRTPAPVTHSLRSVRFLKSCDVPRATPTQWETAYLPNEIAGFSPAVATRLVEAGLATYASPAEAA